MNSERQTGPARGGPDRAAMEKIRVWRRQLKGGWHGRLRDRPRLLKRLRRIEDAMRSGRRVARELGEWSHDVRESEHFVRKCQEQRPVIAYPADLPIAAHRAEIAKAVAENPVVVVSGDTGSGKTTQLPKICLELGLGAAGMIGCTQPRRLAAMTVADRVAQELGRQTGGLVGWQTRFGRQLSRSTQVKFMTDGILLAETRGDRNLLAYDTLIIDEAHERSLNIDFLCGYVKRLLATRPELKVIVSSATLDVERFSEFFDAPVVSVPGQLFPVEVHYRGGNEDDDLSAQVARTVDAIGGEGDILVFLSGQRDIRETADRLRGRRYAGTEVIPLMASLPPKQQKKAFRVASHRRIVLATNVAETSVTIPGIRYVIDSGVARISRYSHRTQVQRLHIEPISQASANQRKGRCGRLGPGTCYRLFDEDDFNNRDAFTDPEIRRTSLASVILTMIDLKLGKIEAFPFLEPPSPAMIRDGYRELYELGALDEQQRLTPMGRGLARLPIEPRFGRMLFAAAEERSLEEVLTIVAALTTDDPRLRPIEQREQADQLHRRFQTETSDFAGLIKLWRFLEQARAELRSEGRMRNFCRKHFISYRRMREWRDVREQLVRHAGELGLKRNRSAASDEAIHKALLHGLLSRIGLKTERGDYRGARGLRFFIFPGSGLFKNGPKWVMAGELVDTTRLYARCVGAINPDWIEPIARTLCSYSYHSPYWDAETGFVRALERVSLYGLPLVTDRRRDFSRIEPERCRALFIRHALMAGEWPRKPAFLKANLKLVEKMRRVEHKTRHREVLIHEEQVFDFYDERLPRGVCNAKDLRDLCKTSGQVVESLRMKPEDLSQKDMEIAGYPDHITIEGRRLPLHYRHERGHEQDGITVEASPAMLSRLKSWRADWLVPGALREKVTYLIYSLPKTVRRQLSPLEETVDGCLARMKPYERPLVDALRDALRELRGVTLPHDVEPWREETFPVYLRVNFCAVTRSGKLLAQGRDLDALIEAVADDHGVDAANPVGDSEGSFERKGLTRWDFGDLPTRVAVGEKTFGIYGYPALVDRGDCVDVVLAGSPAEAAAWHRAGTRRLFALALGKAYKALSRRASMPMSAAAYYQQLGGDLESLGRELAAAAINHVLLDGREPVRTQAAFEARLAEGQTRLQGERHDLLRLASGLLTGAAELGMAIDADAGAAAADLQVQLAHLLFPGFVAHISVERLGQYPRYFEAIRRRLERLRTNPAGDAQKAKRIEPYWQRYVDLITATPRPAHDSAALVTYRWMLEEYRVSLFAQELRTPVKISDKRLEKQWANVTGTAPASAPGETKPSKPLKSLKSLDDL